MSHSKRSVLSAARFVDDAAGESSAEEESDVEIIADEEDIFGEYVSVFAPKKKKKKRRQKTGVDAAEEERVRIIEAEEAARQAADHEAAERDAAMCDFDHVEHNLTAEHKEFDEVLETRVKPRLKTLRQTIGHRDPFDMHTESDDDFIAAEDEVTVPYVPAPPPPPPPRRSESMGGVQLANVGYSKPSHLLLSHSASTFKAPIAPHAIAPVSRRTTSGSSPSPKSSSPHIGSPSPIHTKEFEIATPSIAKDEPRAGVYVVTYEPPTDPHPDPTKWTIKSMSTCRLVSKPMAQTELEAICEDMSPDTRNAWDVNTQHTFIRQANRAPIYITAEMGYNMMKNFDDKSRQQTHEKFKVELIAALCPDAKKNKRNNVVNVNQLKWPDATYEELYLEAVKGLAQARQKKKGVINKDYPHSAELFHIVNTAVLQSISNPVIPFNELESRHTEMSNRLAKCRDKADDDAAFTNALQEEFKENWRFLIQIAPFIVDTIGTQASKALQVRRDARRSKKPPTH